MGNLDKLIKDPVEAVKKEARVINAYVHRKGSDQFSGSISKGAIFGIKKTQSSLLPEESKHPDSESNFMARWRQRASLAAEKQRYGSRHSFN